MARPISELTRHFSDEDRRIVEQGKELLLMECALLSELGRNQDLTQQELVDILDIRESAISRIENQEDTLLWAVERYIRALGGELEVTAKFLDREVKLTQFTTPKEGGEARAQ